jgi:hypothetical protein
VTRATAINLAKLAVVLALLWLVLSSIRWRDATTTKRGDATVAVRPGDQADGTRIEVTPGFLTYVRNLDWWLFGLGAACYFLSASFAAVRWWWLLRVNQLNVTSPCWRRGASPGSACSSTTWYPGRPGATS